MQHCVHGAHLQCSTVYIVPIYSESMYTWRQFTVKHSVHGAIVPRTSVHYLKDVRLYLSKQLWYSGTRSCKNHDLLAETYYGLCGMNNVSRWWHFAQISQGLCMKDHPSTTVLYTSVHIHIFKFNFCLGFLCK